MKLLHFRVGVVASCQKLGIILETKGDLKMDVQKMSITKKCAPKSYSWMKKTSERFGWFLT